MGSKDVSPVEQVSVTDVWSKLESDPASVLIDVRTTAEWAFVGVPDLTGIGKSPVFVEWQTFPGGQPNPAFGEQLSAALDERKTAKDDELFFLCRSGARSHSAARLMAGQGYQKCRNVTEGFEGPLDPDRHRGRTSGWKFAGLPWVQA